MKKILLFFPLIALLSNPAYTQAQTWDNLFSDFISTDWQTVAKAKIKIENLQESAIPKLLEILKNNEIQKLVNTGDLIYPGAEKFLGHGQIVDYDIDKIDIRAGWLLEDLTFQNFGFSGIHIAPEKLKDFIKKNFTEYYNSIPNREYIKKATIEEKRQLIKKLSIENVEKWYVTKSKWTRLMALKDALNSADEKRQVKALSYMRNGQTACKGLDQEFYKKELESSIKNLTKSHIRRISEQAKQIYMDYGFDWIELKKDAKTQFLMLPI